MSDGTEIIVAETWLITRLAAEQTAEQAANPAYVPVVIHNEAVPQELRDLEGAFPCIVIRSRPQRADSRGAPGETVWSNLDYLVEAINREGTFSGLAPYVRVINRALHRQSGAAAGGEVVSCVRSKPFKLRESAFGKLYQRLGHDFTLEVMAPEE